MYDEIGLIIEKSDLSNRVKIRRIIIRWISHRTNIQKIEIGTLKLKNSISGFG